MRFLDGGRSGGLLAGAALLLLSVAGSASAQPAATTDSELPMRKQGLWSMTVTSGPLAQGKMVEMCVGAAPVTSQSLLEGVGLPKACTVSPGRTPAAGGYRFDVICAMNGLTLNGALVLTGDFEALYTGRFKAALAGADASDPPMIDATFQGKWEGACPLELGAGDIRSDGKIRQATPPPP